MTETTYREVDSWPLGNGDRVIIVEAERVRVADNQRGEPWFTFHWNVIARNGRSVEIGGETYTRKSSAKRAAMRHHPRVDAADD